MHDEPCDQCPISFSEVDLDCSLKHRDLTLLQYMLSLLLREVYLLTVESVQNQEGMSCFSSMSLPTITLDTSTEPFLVAQMVKNLPAMQDTWLQSLGRKDLLENYPLSILACETIYHRLGLKPMCWDLNPAKTLLGT